MTRRRSDPAPGPRDPDRDALDLVLLAHDRREIPCRDADPHTGKAWISDHREDQDVAARMCLPCPCLDTCREYVVAHPRESGVYGATTDFDRRVWAERVEAIA